MGDALGAPVEFLGEDEIRRRFGHGGIREFDYAYGRVGAITDDTQMALFTAEGLLRGATYWPGRENCDMSTAVHQAYMRWLRTQGESVSLQPPVAMDGWLIQVRALWSKRAPGNTCLSALRTAKEMGQPAVNDSKGCGGVMRIAPVGLVAGREQAFELGSRIAALTHGHPSGFLSAGFLALLIAETVAGTALAEGIQKAKESLRSQPDHGEVLAAVMAAEALAGLAGGRRVEPLGQGWIAEEALAIALYSALVTSDFEEAVVLAVNHSGDSDSTGAIAGNLCGAMYGTAAVPARWLEVLEMRNEITAIADDIASLRAGTLDVGSEQTKSRYPGCY